MTRLPQLTHDQLDPAQAATWEAIVDSPRGASVMGPGETLVGPFNVMVHARGTGAQAARLGEELRFRSSLDRRLFELAACTVASHWKAEFEWAAHARFAKAEGVSDDVIAALARGDQPAFDLDDERVVHGFVQELVTAGEVGAEADAAVHDLLGDGGQAELVTLVGYYTLVSFLLNTFEVSPPAGSPPAWR